MQLALVGVCVAIIGCGSSTDALIAQLSDPSAEIRRTAARELGTNQGNQASAAAALASALEDSDLEVRELAAASLGRIGAEAKLSLPELEQALHDPQLSVRLTAALAIQKIDPHLRTHEAVLIKSLQSGDGTVFLEIGRMGADAKWAVPTLTKLLSHQQPKIRALSAQTLGRIGAAASAAKSALRQRLRDPDPMVRKAAQHALPNVESPADRDTLPPNTSC
jgi:HEAT repeat protein